jgi:hypothetical protein
MREKKSLDAILGGFDPSEPEAKDSLRDRKPITIWVPAYAKERYDRIQQKSGRRFSKKARELLLAALEMAES